MVPEPRVIAWSEMESPIGPLTLAMTPRGICYIDFGAGERTQIELKVWARRPVPLRPPGTIRIGNWRM